jgi:hypothetical protein
MSFELIELCLKLVGLMTMTARMDKDNCLMRKAWTQKAETRTESSGARVGIFCSALRRMRTMPLSQSVYPLDYTSVFPP